MLELYTKLIPTDPSAHYLLSRAYRSIDNQVAARREIAPPGIDTSFEVVIDRRIYRVTGAALRQSIRKAQARLERPARVSIQRRPMLD